MAGLKKTLFCLLLMLLVAAVVGCGNENRAFEDAERPLTASNSNAELPTWLLLEHRSEMLSDEELGFVAIESEYRAALEEHENDELDVEPEEKKAASSLRVSASSAGSSSGNSSASPQQNSGSGSW